MGLVFDMLLERGGDTDIPLGGLKESWNTVYVHITPKPGQGLGNMKTSAVMSVTQGIMYYMSMSEEGFTHRGIVIYDEETRTNIGEATLTDFD